MFLYRSPKPWVRLLFVLGLIGPPAITAHAEAVLDTKPIETKLFETKLTESKPADTDISAQVTETKAVLTNVNNDVNNKVNSIDLQQALALTLARNPQLYQFNFIQKRLDAERQISELSPSINAELELENFAGSGQVSGLNSAEMTLALSSAIELGGKRNARTHYADTKKSLTELQQQAQTLSLLGELTRQYIRALAAQESKQLAQGALALASELVNIVADKSLRGAASEAELLRAKAAKVRAQIRVHKLKANLKIHRRQLANYWADEQPSFVHLSGDLFYFSKSQSFAKLLIDVQQAPATQVYVSQARLKDAELALVRANNRSNLTWRFGLKHFEETGDAGFTGALSMPLGSQKRNRGHVSAVLAERNALDYEAKATRQRLATQLYQAYTQREQNIEAVRLMQQDAIPHLEQALSLTRNAYENGRYRFQDWMAAQEELLVARQSLIDMAADGLVHQAIIEQLTGQALGYQ